MNKKVNLNGKRFGKLFVVEVNGCDKYGHRIWKCQCDCGNIHHVTTGDLLKGKTNSCGCYRSSTRKEKNITHNLTNHRLYRIYAHIKERCYSIDNQDFKYYGNRGIKMCDEWKNDFMNFYDWALANGYQDGLTIDRINNDGNYEPSNCRWATRRQQTRNRRNSIYVIYHNEQISLKELSTITGISYTTLYNRYKNQKALF